MKSRLSVSLIAFVAIGAVLLTPPVLFGWEADVHYGLTFWLATQAGFSPEDAHRVAALDQSYDDSAYTSAVSAMMWILARGDEVAAREVQRRHFPSGGSIPSDPAKRTVLANSAYARQAAETAVKSTPAANALDVFGQALHPFQDSWSHAGIPDVPFRPGPRVRPDLSFAHPENRGGWWKHDADLTNKHVGEAVTVARETYKLMLTFLLNNPRFRKHAATEWSKLEPLALALIKASTRNGKGKWFAEFAQAAPIQTSALVNVLTLPGVTPTHARSRLLPVSKEYHGDAPQDLMSQAGEFLDVWLVKKDIGKAIAFIDWSVLREQLRSSDEGVQKLMSGQDGVRTWSAKTLTMYLADDHAAVNEAGHGDPSASGYRSLPESAVRDGIFQSHIDITPPPLSQDRFARVAGGDFAIAIQFEHLPYDAVGFVWRKVGGRWVIVQVIPVVG